MDSICGRELIDVSSALGSPIVVVMGGGLSRCTLTTPTDHTSPPPLKLLLYSMQSDKSNSEIGFANPNENHVQGEFSQEIYMHLKNMCLGGFIATKSWSWAVGR